LPDRGNSSPVVWGRRVLLTQAEGSKRSVLCFDRADGKLLWQRATTYDRPEKTHATNPYCSATPVTDGERVIASLGSAGLVCYDLDGEELWRKDVGTMDHIWGNASSPILYGDLCILWVGPGKTQVLLAVDTKDGKTAWQHEEPGGRNDAGRPYVGSWTTPLVVRAGDHDELILGVPEKLKAFDPKTGKELWSCDGLHNATGDQLVYTSPVYADGIVVIMAGFGGGAMAVRAGGSGDVTKTHRLWYRPRNDQRIGSPVVVGDRVYIVNDTGVVQCLELRTGKDVWEKERVGSSWSSMVATADGRLYVPTRDGDTLVFAAGPKYELLARNRLGEPIYASLAISDGDVFIRTYKHLWCIGGKK
jgi:outer membrane protein assembly factor BamB